MGPSLPGAGASSSVRVGASSAVSSNRQGQLSLGQRRAGLAQHDLLISSCMVPMAPEGPQTPAAAGPWTQILVLGSSLGPDDIMAMVGSTGHSGRDGSGGSMVPEHQQGFRLWRQLQLL